MIAGIVGGEPLRVPRKPPAVHESVALSRLAVVACSFNPSRSRNRGFNCKRFINHMADRGIELHLATEAGSDVLWHKERMLNLAIAKLPSEVDAVSWVDADLLVEVDFESKVLKTLANCPVAQAWNVCEYLDAGGAVANWWNEQDAVVSMAAYNLTRWPPDVSCGKSHPGFAWCARRDTLDAIGGLYELDLAGGGDTSMACGFWGKDEPYYHTAYNDAIRASTRAWRDRAFSVVQGHVGCALTRIQHMYHGTRQNRRYWERIQTISRMGYDPMRHVVREPGKPLRWSESAPDDLKSWVAEYLQSGRNEDDVLQAGA